MKRYAVKVECKVHHWILVDAKDEDHAYEQVEWLTNFDKVYYAMDEWFLHNTEFCTDVTLDVVELESNDAHGGRLHRPMRKDWEDSDDDIPPMPLEEWLKECAELSFPYEEGESDISKGWRESGFKEFMLKE